VTAEAEVRAAATAFVAALLANDAPAVADFMTDDWVYVDKAGVTTKSDVIGRIVSGRLVHHTMSVVGGERFAPAGDAVVVTARKASSGEWDGARYTADEWISEVWVRAGGRWRLAFSQKTDATPPRR
jgi:ketosteroid isomerase-like protein